MAQSVKCLPHKQEDLSQISRTRVKSQVLHLLTQPDERETGDRRFPRQHVWMHWQAPASLKYPVWKIKVESRRGRYSMSAYTDVNL